MRRWIAGFVLAVTATCVSVEWRFDDGGLLHHVESPGLFDSGITGDGTFRHTFESVGVYEYSCSVHPYMIGVITVL